MSVYRISLALIASTSLGACATMPIPTNPAGAQYQAQQLLEPQQSAAGCMAPVLPLSLANMQNIGAEAFRSNASIIAPGDRMRLTVSGDQNTLTGVYVINANGQLELGDTLKVQAAGVSAGAVQSALRLQLVRMGMIRDIANNIRLQLEVAAPVSVSVEGAVFEPGNVRAGERGPELQATTVNNAAGGDFNASRTLATALRAAGGLRPDATISTVYLVRGGKFASIDLSTAFGGTEPMDPQLAAGDRIIVPTAGCFQPELVRPSSVTAPGVRVYMSNLSRPAASNAASAIGKDSTSLPYGTRLLQGLISANCVGGSSMNAARSAVLISRNPINGKSVVIKRSVEDLVRNANRDSANPYLMPNDAIACYDSRAMSFVDAVGVLGNLLGPAALVKGLGL